jgi:tRNA(fMet)-specific endonuclease VapC
MKKSGTELVARLVLDTSAYSHFRYGHEVVLGFMAAAGLILLPTTVLGELEAGFELGARKKENRVLLSQFLEEPFVSILPVTRAVARRYGQLFAQLRRAGTPIPINDIWIAASVLDCGGHLLTFDEDFRCVESLDCTILEQQSGQREAT